MRQTRLVLFEGIPGSGKSTTGQYLARQMTDQGLSVRWWYEEEADHPVWLFRDLDSLQHLLARIDSGDVAGVVSDSLDRWRQFAATQQHNETLALLDSTLFGYLTWTLFPGDVPPSVIRAYLAEVGSILTPLDPCLIYFRQQDVGASLRRVLDQRGTDLENVYIARVANSTYGRRHNLHGFDGLVAFWTAYRDFVDAAVSALNLSTLVIETDTNAWSTYRHQLLTYMGLPLPTSDTLPPDDLTRFVGTYLPQNNRDGEGICKVCLENDSLYLFGFPLLWPRTRLIPRTLNIFDVESFPFTATFSANVAHPNMTLTITGPATGFQPAAWVFHQVSTPVTDAAVH